MSSVNSIRVPGLATGMDTDTMVKEMLANEQVKVDKAKQKEQTIKWQQEIYREVITSIKGFQDKFFSLTSSSSILTSKSWNTLSVSSSSPNVMTATGSAGANSVNYKFNITELAQPPSVSVTNASNGKKIENTSTLTLGDLGIGLGDEESKTFKISLGDGKYSNDIIITKGDTVDSLISKINGSTSGEVKASYSSMTGSFTIQGSKTGNLSTLQMVETQKDLNGNDLGSNALEFLGIDSSIKSGTNSKIEVTSGTFTKQLDEQSNNFTIDGVTYNITGKGESIITSKQDVQPLVDNMKAFVEEYNKIMDKVYNLIIQKKNSAYPPLTDAQKEDMSEEEIARWETKAKEGLLRNDSEMSRFMDDMQRSIFGDNMSVLNDMGLRTPDDYNKRGQLYLDADKFTTALQTNGNKVYELFAKNNTSVLNNMKNTMYKYVGTSSSVFASKAGLENTASVVKNLYSEQLRIQSELIMNLQRRMDDKEESLYKKFAALEASMNKFNSQMNYLSGTTMQQ